MIAAPATASAMAASAATAVDAGAKSRNPNSGNTDTNEQSEWQKHQGEEEQHYRSVEEGVQHTSNTRKNHSNIRKTMRTKPHLKASPSPRVRRSAIPDRFGQGFWCRTGTGPAIMCRVCLLASQHKELVSKPTRNPPN